MSMISKGQDCFIFWSRFSQIYFLKLWRPQAYSGQGLVYIAIALIKQIHVLHLDYKKNQHITKRWSIHFQVSQHLSIPHLSMHLYFPSKAFSHVHL